MMTIIQAKSENDLTLGRQGENLARQVVFDLSAWEAEYGPGTVELIHQRPGDTSPYPVAAVREGSTLVWTLTATDTAVASSYGSDGHCELRYYVGEVLVKSRTWLTKVIRAMSTPSETAPPEPEQGWVDQVVAVGAAAKASADAAKADADRATALAAEVSKKAAQTAKDAVQSAQAKEAAQTAQRLAEEAQSAAEAARTAAAAAQAAAETAATDAAGAKQDAETAQKAAQDAAAAAANTLESIQTLYQEMQTWAQGVIQDVNAAGSAAVQSVQSAGDAQVQRVTDEGTTQTANAKAQANAAAQSAAGAAQSAQQAEESAAVYDNVVADVNQLKQDIVNVNSVIIDGTNVPAEKELNWINAYVSSAGQVRGSSLSQTCVVPMKKGEVVTIGTANSNITIIGSTTAESVAVGDIVTVIQKTTPSGEFETYTYTATDNINIVLCVLRENYNLSFSAPIYVQNKINDIAKEMTTMQDYVPGGITEGYVLARPVVNGSFLSTGLLTTGRTNRIRTALIPYKANDRIAITNGSLQHAVGMWDGTPSVSTSIRNDSSAISVDETIETSADGYIVIVFKKSDNTDILPSDFDGEIRLYNTLAYHTAVDAVGDPVPNYYIADDYLKNKASRINTLGKEGDDVFAFITDIHWELNAKHSPSLMKYLSKKCAIHKVFDGGDVSNSLMVEVYKKYRDTIKGNSYHVTGNHDWFTPNNGKALYYAMDSANNNQIGDAFGHYYYVDNVQQKIRYVILNGFTRAEGSSTITSAYSADEIAWFRDTALNLPSSEWDVLVFTHYLRTTTINIAGGSDIENTIDTFNANSSHAGKVLAVFQGHAHWDGIYHTAGGVPVITTTCDKWDLSNETSTIPAEGIAWREKNTIKEQAFDVVILNREARKFTCVRIGAPAQNNIDKYRTDSGFTWIGTLEEREITY